MVARTQQPALLLPVPTACSLVFQTDGSLESKQLVLSPHNNHFLHTAAGGGGGGGGSDRLKVMLARNVLVKT